MNKITWCVIYLMKINYIWYNYTWYKSTWTWELGQSERLSFYIFNPLYFGHDQCVDSSLVPKYCIRWWIFSPKFTQIFWCGLNRKADILHKHKIFSNLTFQCMLTAWELLAKGGLLDDWSTNNMTLDFWCFTAEQRDERPLLLISIAKWKRDEAKT